jgi:hypothetical protein
MVKEYAIKLIENLPLHMKNNNQPQKIDLVLDGGIFNGSYLIGALHFLKEMENQKIIKINRISSCSIGTVAAFLYYIDALDEMPKLYNIVNNEFKENYNLNSITKLKSLLINVIPKDICKTINKKLFITFYNIKKGIKQIKYKYDNIDDIINTIIKSCFVPYLIDGNLLFKNKYFDGVNPYVFNIKPNIKILYLDLFGYDKIGNLLNVKNEKTNCHRILSGMLDIHNFFIKQHNTSMCSYVNDWNLFNKGWYNIKIILEKLLIYFVYFLVYIREKIPSEFKKSAICKLFFIIISEISVILLETYCL